VSTLLDLVEDLIQSAYGQGFRRFLILNGHGGNDPARGRLYELANRLPDIRIAWYAWWVANSVQAVAQKHELKPAHANWLEAFEFTRVGDLPAGEKVPTVVPGLMSAAQARQVYGDGSFGGYYQVDEAVMDELFAAAVQDVLQLLRFD
jgi:creatinine amidohydrolase